MKKKVIALLLATMMSFSMVACGGSDTSSEAEALKKENADLKKQVKQLQEEIEQLSQDFSEKEEASVSSDSNNVEKTNTYGAGETWTVDNLWNFTINSVTSTDERNEYSEKTPVQVLIIDYSYENLGYQDDSMELYFCENQMQVIDTNKELGDSYPGDTVNSPQETPVGAKCANAQICIGINNESSEVTINVSQYDNEFNEYKATFVVPVN